MNILQMRIEVQNALKAWVGNLMATQNVPAHIMEDALKSCLVDVKEASLQEFLQSLIAGESVESVEEENENGE